MSSLSLMWAHFCPSAAQRLPKFGSEVGCYCLIFFFFPHHPHMMMKVCGAQEKIASTSDEQTPSRFLNRFCTNTSVWWICYFFIYNCKKALKDEGVCHERRGGHTLHTPAKYAEPPLTLMCVSLDCGWKLERTHAEKGELQPVTFLL